MIRTVFKAATMVVGLGGTVAHAGDEPNLKECRFIQSGEASWYGPGFNGKKTASGAIFNQDKMTAAHNSLPFGTVVTAVNIENGNVAELTINDTGAFAKYDRIMDASLAGAEALGYEIAGHTEVKLYLC